jgi:hypothetical protein
VFTVKITIQGLAGLNHHTIGPRIRAQDQWPRTLLVARTPGRPPPFGPKRPWGDPPSLTTKTTVDLGDASQQQILVDAAVGILKAGHSG